MKSLDINNQEWDPPFELLVHLLCLTTILIADSVMRWRKTDDNTIEVHNSPEYLPEPFQQ